MGEYLEALEAHAEATNPDASKGEIKTDIDRLKKFRRAQARRGGGKAAGGGNVAKGEGA